MKNEKRYESYCPAKVDVCIYHDADSDGIMSAAIMLKKYPDIKLVGYNYQAEFFNRVRRYCAGKTVAIVDCSPKHWPDMHQLCIIAKDVIWIDHHKTAYEEMLIHETASFENFHCVWQENPLGACDKVWRYVYGKHLVDPPTPLPIRMAAQYDTYNGYGTFSWDRAYAWYFILKQRRTPEAMLNLVSASNDSSFAALEATGVAIAEHVDSENAYAIKNAVCATYQRNGIHANGLLINRLYSGDVFKSLDDESIDFVGGFSLSRSRWTVSLRGRNGFDVSAIAKHHGGGGHKAAAGFGVDTYMELAAIFGLPGTGDWHQKAYAAMSDAVTKDESLSELKSVLVDYASITGYDSELPF